MNTANASNNAMDGLLRQIDEAWVRAGELPRLFASDGLARRVVHARWVTPIVKGKRLTIYSLKGVLEARGRIERGELPPLIPKSVTGRSAKKSAKRKPKSGMTSTRESGKPFTADPNQRFARKPRRSNQVLVDTVP